MYYLPLVFILMTNTQGEIYCGVSNSGIKIDFLEKNECTEIISCFWFSSKTKKPTELKQKIHLLTLRVFAISAFLKVIHAPKTPKRGDTSGTSNVTFPHIFFQILAIGTSHRVYKQPISRVSCISNENSENFFFSKN